METKTTLSSDGTIKKLRKLLRSLDKFNNSIDIYDLCIKKKLKDKKEE